MALTALENRYLDSMAEREFPTLPPMESAEVMGEQQDAMPADAPMQLAQAGGGLPPAEMRPTPRNPVVGGIADFVRNVRSMADQYEIKDWVPLLGGMGVGELLIGKAPEEIEEWAYGNAPMRIPEMSNIPVMKTGRGEQLADTAFLGLDAAGITKGLGVIGKGAARQLGPKAAEMTERYMQRTGMMPGVVESDYRGLHTAPMRGEGAAPAHNLTQIYPDDIYSPNAAQYYGHFGGNNPMDVSSIAIIRDIKNRPDKRVTIYRAIPKDVKASINQGDWVTINRNYAKDHGESTLNGEYKIVSKTVDARDIYTDGNSIHEWGYDPTPYTPIRERPLYEMPISTQKKIKESGLTPEEYFKKQDAERSMKESE
jgi:hypothetical protein